MYHAQLPAHRLEGGVRRELKTLRRGGRAANNIPDSPGGQEPVLTIGDTSLRVLGMGGRPKWAGHGFQTRDTSE